MKKFLLAAACLLALSACQAHNPRTGGALVGGLAGGLLGNTIGKGSGRTAATVGGAILGTIVGSELAGGSGYNSNHSPHQGHGGGHNHGHGSVGVSQCDHIGNAGARASCEQGVSERDRQKQRQAEDYAYQCGRYGRCDPNTYNNNRPYYRNTRPHYYRNNHDPSRALHGNALRAYNCNRYGRCN